MCAHREPHGVLPAGIFPHFIVRHAECRLPFFTALFHCPPDTAEPDQRAERRTGRRMTDRGGLGRLGAAGPLAHSPDGALWQPGLPSGHALTRKVIRHRPRGPFRACPPLPLPRWQGRGQQRVSEERATKAGGPTQASSAARQSGLLPYTLAATMSLQGSSPSCLILCHSAAARCGFVCNCRASGPWHLTRRAAYRGPHQTSGRKSR
jgi:hypothetical protein